MIGGSLVRLLDKRAPSDLDAVAEVVRDAVNDGPIPRVQQFGSMTARRQVWWLPVGRVILELSGGWSVRPCLRPVGAGHGPLPMMPSAKLGPNQKHAFREHAQGRPRRSPKEAPGYPLQRCSSAREGWREVGGDFVNVRQAELTYRAHKHLGRDGHEARVETLMRGSSLRRARAAAIARPGKPRIRK